MADFQHYIGSDRNFILTWQTGPSTPLNITGATHTIHFSLSPTDAPIVTKDTAGGGVTLTTPASGIATVVMDEADFNTISEETEVMMGITMSLSGRTYKQIKTVNLVPVP